VAPVKNTKCSNTTAIQSPISHIWPGKEAGLFSDGCMHGALQTDIFLQFLYFYTLHAR